MPTSPKDGLAADAEALNARIARKCARRLAKLGGSDPQAEAPPRRRAEAFDVNPMTA